MSSTETMLEVRDLRVTFGGTHALDGVSFSVPRGSTFGLIGPNGAGKSTLIDAVTGYLPQAQGDVLLEGRSLGGVKPHARMRRGLSRTFQTLELFEDLTVRENLLVAAEERNVWGNLLDLVRPPRSRAEARVDHVLEALDIADLGDAMPGELSHGHRERVSVARALAPSPRLLLLDEPAAGLDTEESQALGRRLRALVDEEDITVFLVDHDMGLVLGLCDRIHVLDFGRTIAEGTPAEIRRDDRVVAAYLGAGAEAEALA